MCSLRNTAPSSSPTTGVKYVGIIARAIPVRSSSVPNATNATPVPTTPSTETASNETKENSDRVIPGMATGKDHAAAANCTRMSKRAGEYWA